MSYRNPSGRYFYGHMEPVWLNYFSKKKCKLTRTRFGYFVQMYQNVEHYQVSMRLPGASMLPRNKFRRRLERAKTLEKDFGDDYSDDEFIPLPKHKKQKNELADIASAVAEGQIITRSRKRTGSNVTLVEL